MYFDTKSYLKSTRNHTAKHALRQLIKLSQKISQQCHDIQNNYAA
jgi:hypothetical protein